MEITLYLLGRKKLYSENEDKERQENETLIIHTGETPDKASVWK